ncbi:hypothetical protein ACM55F_17170 [Flavobacterium sp. XS2P12]
MIFFLENKTVASQMGIKGKERIKNHLLTIDMLLSKVIHDNE